MELLLLAVEYDLDCKARSGSCKEVYVALVPEAKEVASTRTLRA